MGEIDAEVMHEGVEIYQVATLNPHFHEDKGDSHVDDMTRCALSTVFHSPITPDQVKEEILTHIGRQMEDNSPLEPVIADPPLSSLDWEVFQEVMARDAVSFERIDRPGLNPPRVG